MSFEISNGTLIKYYGNENIVRIPYGVISIGCQAFYGCSMQYVEIPDTVERIESHAFAYCTMLNNVNIPYRVKLIDFNAFYGCASLTNLYISDSVTGISPMAFNECQQLRKIHEANNLCWNCGGSDFITISSNSFETKAVCTRCNAPNIRYRRNPYGI